MNGMAGVSSKILRWNRLGVFCSVHTSSWAGNGIVEIYKFTYAFITLHEAKANDDEPHSSVENITRKASSSHVCKICVGISLREERRKGAKYKSPDHWAEIKVKKMFPPLNECVVFSLSSLASFQWINIRHSLSSPSTYTRRGRINGRSVSGVAD